MDYQKIYDNIIERAKNRELTGYFEKHHILPKCLGGTDEQNNLVKLTAREHFIVHQLLAMIYPNHHGLIHAAKIMMGCKRYNSKQFEWVRKKAVKTSIEFHTGRKRKKETCVKISNALKGKRKGIKFTEEHKNKISKGRKGIVFSDTHKENLSKREISNEWKENLSLSMKGRIKPKSEIVKQKEFWSKEENREKARQNSLKFTSVKIVCLHCGKESSKQNYIRWHGDNCKEKNNGV